ncbi:hypothetical protein HAX54_016722, partial [Datura stramonium]|nr:hypothetical protein [Datura stramonium]
PPPTPSLKGQLWPFATSSSDGQPLTSWLEDRRSFFNIDLSNLTIKDKMQVKTAKEETQKSKRVSEEEENDDDEANDNLSLTLMFSKGFCFKQFSTGKARRDLKPPLTSGRENKLWQSLISRDSKEVRFWKSLGSENSSQHQRSVRDLIKLTRSGGRHWRFGQELILRRGEVIFAKKLPCFNSCIVGISGTENSLGHFLRVNFLRLGNISPPSRVDHSSRSGKSFSNSSWSDGNNIVLLSP